MILLATPVTLHMIMSDVVYSLRMKPTGTVLLKTIYSAYAAEKIRRELRDCDFMYSIFVFG